MARRATSLQGVRDAFEGSGYINVYKSDGTTVIGRFAIGIPDDGSHPATTSTPGPISPLEALNGTDAENGP